MYWKSDPMFVCRLDDKDLPALGGPSEKVSGAVAQRERAAVARQGLHGSDRGAGARCGAGPRREPRAGWRVPPLPAQVWGSRDRRDHQRRGSGRALQVLAYVRAGTAGASPAAADEDSCSSSAALSPSSSPRSMASGSGCAPNKCVCSSCGLEIVDKYLLKVRAPAGPCPSGGGSGLT
ncbi:LIM/homeobox protein Lhx8 [Aix galericulata]|nr:LIM/homeobox protein Lhx8 [Aix galericulata]